MIAKFVLSLLFEERDDKTVSVTYEWTASGVVPLKEELQSIPITELRELYTRFVSEGIVMVRDTEVFQKEHPDIRTIWPVLFSCHEWRKTVWQIVVNI